MVVNGFGFYAHIVASGLLFYMALVPVSYADIVTTFTTLLK